MEQASTAFYLDWSFWAVVVALLAIVLSQLPPVLSWFRRPKIEIEPYSKIAITHKVGNPNLQIHLIVNNTGGRQVRIKDISVRLRRDGIETAHLPAQNFLQHQTDKNTLLFTAFSLKPGEEWAHITNFLHFFNREDENLYRSLEQAMLADFHAKRDALGHEPKEFIEIEDRFVQPFHEFFRNKFIWSAGEYDLTIYVKTDRPSADLERHYRFTLFESHVSQLEAITEFFKYGGGISWDPNVQTNIIVDLKEA